MNKSKQALRILEAYSGLVYIRSELNDTLGVAIIEDHEELHDKVLCINIHNNVVVEIRVGSYWYEKDRIVYDQHINEIMIVIKKHGITNLQNGLYAVLLESTCLNV